MSASETDQRRFKSLHGFALTLIDQLVAQFAVERVEGYDLDPEWQSGERVRPSVCLTPHDAGAAPVTFHFSGFPGGRPLKLKPPHSWQDSESVS